MIRTPVSSSPRLPSSELSLTAPWVARAWRMNRRMGVEEGVR